MKAFSIDTDSPNLFPSLTDCVQHRKIATHCTFVHWAPPGRCPTWALDNIDLILKYLMNGLSDILWLEQSRWKDNSRIYESDQGTHSLNTAVKMENEDRLSSLTVASKVEFPYPLPVVLNLLSFFFIWFDQPAEYFNNLNEMTVKRTIRIVP